MCGIIGCTLPDECPPELMERMLASLSKRGPDAQGTWRNHQVALGHRRLSILDTSDRGAQPMSTADRRVHIIYNGEFYNHLEIRKRLPNREWRSHCDTETLLGLYEEEGPEFVRHINGMFAFALYDEREGRILLYRDRLGIKPLYFAHGGRFLAFASTLRPLMLHPRVGREIDPDALRDYFLFNYIPGRQSILRDVRKLPPGHYLEFDIERGALAEHTWWRARDYLRADTAPPSNRERVMDEKADELESLILDAVKLRTISDVPLGCFLSGGIDSSMVAWALTRAGEGAVKTFNTGFEQARYDESYYAQRVARKLGTEHEWRHFTKHGCLETLKNIGEVLDEPFADASILPTLMLSEMTRRHVTVSLSGDGGDELFLGYDRYAWAEKVRARMGAFPGPLRRTGAHLAAGLPNYRLQMMANALLYRDADEIYPYVFTGWNQPFVNRLLDRRDDFSRHAIHHISEGLPNLSRVRAASFTDINHYLPDDILTKVDRASMHYSLEARVPLLDYRIVEFALAQPTWANFGPEGGKLLLKRVLYRHVPEKYFRRPKMGFAVPLHQWLRGPLRPLMRELLGAAELKRHGLFNIRVVRELIKRHETGKWNHERQLWALLAFQVWFNRV